MNTEAHQILVGNLPVDVVRKDIKNLHLGVYPPNGRVRIAAPLRVDDDAVRLFAISKLAWIQRQQAKFAAQERQTPREFVSGESHYFQGRRYLLNVVYDDKPPRVVLRNKKIMDLYVRPRTDVSGRQSVMLGWYRRQLKALAPPLIDKWTDAIDVQLVEWGIKLMKTRWGTCNIEARRIWLNLELIKKPMPCLEYIIVHELVHLLERHHNERFVGLMNRFLPQWRFLREELNRATWLSSLGVLRGAMDGQIPSLCKPTQRPVRIAATSILDERADGIVTRVSTKPSPCKLRMVN